MRLHLSRQVCLSPSFPSCSGGQNYIIEPTTVGQWFTAKIFVCQKEASNGKHQDVKSYLDILLRFHVHVSACLILGVKAHCHTEFFMSGNAS